eukprot:12125597-Prorocentrum_lima.AAC.1
MAAAHQDANSCRGSGSGSVHQFAPIVAATVALPALRTSVVAGARGNSTAHMHVCRRQLPVAAPLESLERSSQLQRGRGVDGRQH